MFKLFKNLTKKEFGLILLAIVFIVVQVWLDLKIPDYMSEITMLVQTEGSEMGDILASGGWMLLCALGSLVSAFIVGYLAAYVGTSFEKHLRSKVYNQVQSYGMSEINKFSTGSLITRATNDVTQVKTFVVMGIQMLAKAPIMAIMAIAKIAGKEWQFSVITIIGVAIVIVMSLVIILVAIPKFKKVQKLTDNLNNITRENLTGIRVIRAYNAEDYQLKKFEKANDKLTDTNLFTQKLMAVMMPTMSLVMNGLSLAIYWVGASIINGAEMMDKVTIFSDMVVFSSYAMQIIMAFMMLIVLFIIYPRATVSARRINEVLETESKIKYGTKTSNDPELAGTIEFKNVSFKYPRAEEYVLEDISFKAKPGETIALIGSTGSGKSTLANLIPRFYDPTDGEIILDGENIKDYAEEYLNDKIGYVSQKAMLFNGSVESNVKLGKIKGKKVKNIRDALRISDAKEFVEKMPEAEKSHISQSGQNISGGQKQRLSIARAVAREPEFYIFDDSFSALDYKTDYAVRKKLNEKTKNATKIIVAQRIGTIMNADQIIVLDNGKIVGKGTHKELLKKCKVYREIAESQLSRKELENA